MKNRIARTALPLVACFVVALPSPALAKAVQVGEVQIELISEVLSLQPGQPLWVAMRFEVNPGWHINWRNAGDAGLPPVVHWELPPGFAAGEIQWPLPERLVVDPLVSYGYEGTVLLPVQITPPTEVEGNVTLRAQVDWLVCKHACIPGGAPVELSLPVLDSAPTLDRRWDTEFANTRFHLPLAVTDWQVGARLDSEFIHLSIEPPNWWQGDPGEVFFLPYATDLIDHNAPQPFVSSERGYSLQVTRARNNPKDPSKVQGILVSSTGWRGDASEQALEVNAEFTDTGEPPAVAAGAIVRMPLVRPLLFAFLGGLILNLMPCVLPVLSIKVLSLVGQAGQSRSAALGHGLLYAGGVLASFWILAGLLLGLRSAGEGLGWGFQLQSPTFVVIVAGLFFVLGLSLFGVFEIGSSLVGLGSRAGARGGALGAFNSGILAVIVATPCTAPFMGSALGFALTQPTIVSLLVFTALGLGLAAPYVVLTSSPALLRLVPKPGAWMETLKQIMGFLLMATVIWLAWLLGNQAGSGAVAVLLSMLLLLAVAAWVWGRWGNVAQSDRSRLGAFVFSSLLVVVALGWGLRGLSLFGGTPARAEAYDSEWLAYDEAELARLLNSGTPVLVDFTADWCLSCKVNEQVALASESVRKRLREEGVTLMKADWTLRDEGITRALARFGRSSVPLYVLYSGKGPDAFVTLPEILTPGIVISALDKL